MRKKREAYGTSEFSNPINKPHMKSGHSYPSKSKIEAAGHEMKMNPPKILAHTKKKFGTARSKAQRVAIMLSKARRGK